MNPIPMIDLQAAHAELAEALEAAALEVLRSGWYVLGPQVRAFEAEFAAWLWSASASALPLSPLPLSSQGRGPGGGVDGLRTGPGGGVPEAVAVNSGTDALHLAVRACEIGLGDEVVVPSHTAVATVAAVEMAGAHPVFADIQADTFTLDPASVAAAITPRTRAIVAVHLYGQAADLDALAELARQRGAWLIEDCAQAHGARSHGRVAGTVGDLACFSFYPTKNLGAAGDGGMVAGRNAELVERVRLLRQYGWRERYVSDVAGFNSRLDELQAALLRVKLRRLDDWNRRRRAIAARYDELLRGAGVVVPAVAPGNEHVYHLYVIRSQQRDALRLHLQKHGIQTAIHYPLPVHQQPAYRHLAPPPGTLGETERAAAEILSLPIYPQMPIEHAERVAECIMQFVG